MVTMGLSLASSGKVRKSPEILDENGFQKGPVFTLETIYNRLPDLNF
jgi:hypothetical protein